MSREEFFEFCQINNELRIERDSEGRIVIMSPAGSNTGRQNFNVGMQLGIWTERQGAGVAFDSSAGFELPNGATRSPDASWMTHEKWNSLEPDQKDSFAPICPDFVLELRSRTDRLSVLTAKMEEYIANGAKLGLLIDPIDQKVYVYRPTAETDIQEKPDRVSCSPEMPGLEFELTKIW